MADRGKERERGILNPRERRYLRGEEGIEPQSQDERSIRQAIRKHLRNSILDFKLLYHYLEKRDRQRVFNPDGGYEDPNLFYDGIRSALALFYSGMEQSVQGFAPVLRAAIFNAVNKSNDRRRAVRVDFDVDISNPDRININTVADKLAAGRGDELTEPELREFLYMYSRAEQFDPDVAVREQEQYQEILERSRTAEDWKALSRDEQEEILVDEMQKRKRAAFTDLATDDGSASDEDLNDEDSNGE